MQYYDDVEDRCAQCGEPLYDNEGVRDGDMRYCSAACLELATDRLTQPRQIALAFDPPQNPMVP